MVDLRRLNKECGTFKCQVEEVKFFKAALRSSQKWLDVTRDCFSGKKKLTVKECIKHIADAASLHIKVDEETKALNAYVLEASQFEKQVLDAAQKGLIVSPSDTATLFERAASLRLDVTEVIHSVSHVTQVYCLCRRKTEGIMVGCDTCDEWYHIKCVGLTKKAVDREDSYVCLKCRIRQMFSSSLEESASAVATTLQAYQAHISAEESDKVLYLEQFFSTEKGKLVMIWLNTAATVLSNENNYITNLLQNPVLSWRMPPTYVTLIDQARENQFSAIPVVAAVCKTIRILVWTIEVLAVFSSAARPTLSNLDAIVQASAAVPVDSVEVLAMLNATVKKSKVWLEAFNSMIQPNRYVYL